MAKALRRVAGDIAIIPREAVGLKLSKGSRVAGDVAVLIPRKAELPAIAAGVKRGGETALGEEVKQGNGGGEVVIHLIILSGFLVLSLTSLHLDYKR